MWNYSELNARAYIVFFLNRASRSHRRDDRMRGRHSYIFKHQRHQILGERRKYNYIKEWICLVLCSQTVETADQMTYTLDHFLGYLMPFLSQKVCLFTVQIILGGVDIYSNTIIPGRFWWFYNKQTKTMYIRQSNDSPKGAQILISGSCEYVFWHGKKWTSETKLSISDEKWGSKMTKVFLRERGRQESQRQERRYNWQYQGGERENERDLKTPYCRLWKGMEQGATI